MRLLAVFVLLSTTLLADTVKIGVILPLSGNNDHLGRPQLNALKLFKEELTQRKTKHQYEFIVEDDQCAAKLTVQAAQKLIHVDKVAALISFTSGPGNAIAPINEKNKILSFCLASDDKVAKGAYNFSHWVRPQPQAPLMAKVLQAKGVKTVGIIFQRQQAFYATTEEFRKVFPKYGIEIVFEESFVPGERDFRPLLLKFPQQLPEAIIPMSLAPELDILLRQMKQQGVFSKSLITSIQAFDVVTDRSLTNGLFYISAAKSVDNFKERFIAVNKIEPDWISPYFYNCLTLMVDGLETCPQPNADRTPALSYLNQLKDFPSAVGTISAGEEGIFDAPLSFYMTTDGKAHPITFDEAVAAPRVK